MSKKHRYTVLNGIQTLQHVAKQIESDLLAASTASAGTEEREKHMLMAISQMADLDDIVLGLSKWWKLEFFKRQWASGFCYDCQGSGKSTAQKCPACRGKGRVACRKPKGSMIPAGWKGSREDTVEK